MISVKYLVVGAGKAGLDTAAALAKRGEECVILEKNRKHGLETSSRNSGVVHRGFYYPPGSLMANLCVRGHNYLSKQDFFRRTGKLVLGSDEYLSNLMKNAAENGIDDVYIVDAADVKRMEPHLRTNVGALYSPNSGMIDQGVYMSHLIRRAAGYSYLLPDCRVTGINPVNDGFVIHTDGDNKQEKFHTEFLVNCAGHNADLIAEMAGVDVKDLDLEQQFVKGVYMSAEGSKGMLNHLVYTEHDKANGTLGIHASPTEEGVRFGPNAFYVSRDYDKYGVEDWHSAEFEEACETFDFVTPGKLRSGYAGVRATLQKKGGPLRDFFIERVYNGVNDRAVHNIGICSPGLTAAIGEMNAELITRR